VPIGHVRKGRLNGSLSQKAQLWVVLCHINRIYSLTFTDCKPKVVVPVDATNAYRRSRGIAPLFFNLTLDTSR
jgi:hypothetical protein